jgi:preprotein translocase subunit SecD
MDISVFNFSNIDIGETATAHLFHVVSRKFLFDRAMELGFGRAWDSIKDANFTTIFTALVLINPLELSFLNTSGLVRGFGITLLIGVLTGLFTGLIVTRTFMRLFLKGSEVQGAKK